MFKKVLFIVSFGMLLAILSMPIQPCTPAYAEEPEPECWAVIIGVPAQRLSLKCDIDAEGNVYPVGVEYPDDDAQEFARQLSSIWGEDHVKLLLDNEATNVDIYYAIKWLADKADADDTVLFYFCGHGAPGYLCSYDYFISDSELGNWLDKLDSERIVIILDTCHAGSFSNKLGKDGREVLMSCQPDESSFEDPELKHGVFTYYILQALSNFDAADTNRDYELSAEEIFYYAKPKTIDEIIAPYANVPAVSKGDKQHPVLYDPHCSGELSLLMKVIFYTKAHFPPDTTVLTVDGKPYLSGELPASFTLAAGLAHNFDIPSQVDAGEGTRLVFTSWDDGDKSVSRAICHGGEYTANYEMQYQLTVESAYGDPEGEGWYDSGSTATISVTSHEGTIIRRVFTGWSGDFTGTEATASVTVNGPKTVTANWRTDYLWLYMLIVGIVALVGATVTVMTYIYRRRRSS